MALSLLEMALRQPMVMFKSRSDGMSQKELKFVVVSDTTALRRMVRGSLRCMGYTDVYGSVNDTKTILGLIHREKPVCVFLEIESEAAHHWETFRQIRQSGQLQGTAVVVVTPASNVKKTMQALWHLSAFDFVTTPCQKISLLEEIDRILNKIRTLTSEA